MLDKVAFYAGRSIFSESRINCILSYKTILFPDEPKIELVPPTHDARRYETVRKTIEHLGNSIK
jgi:hypothetical protein